MLNEEVISGCFHLMAGRVVQLLGQVLGLSGGSHVEVLAVEEGSFGNNSAFMARRNSLMLLFIYLH